MINLRYHIVSITAVFLALGIGLTLGSTFLDRVTVDNLKNQLDTVQERVDETEAENEDLARRVGALTERDAGLADALEERLLDGHLDNVPVLVIATRGTDEAVIDATTAALSAAGGNVAGTWWLTERWGLEDPEDVRALSEMLDLRTSDAGRLRRNAAIRVAELLDAASQAPVPPVPQEPLEDGTIPAETDVAPPQPVEPPLIAQLQQAGFLEYEALVGATDGRVLLPAVAARYVVVSGVAPDRGAQQIATAILDEAVAGGPVPYVAAQVEVELDGTDGGPEDARRTTFVGPLREGELSRERLSTVDHLDTAAGLAAVVLALEDLAELRTGHYGVAPGAARLLPGADAPT